MSFESDHRLYHDLLPQYAAGTLPPETRQRIATHLETCAVCREALEEWRVIVSGLQHEMTGKPPDSASEQTWTTLHAQLHSLSEDRRSSMHDISSSADIELPAATPVVSSAPRRRWMSFVSVAAVAVIILVSVILFNVLGKARPSVGGRGATPAPTASGCKTPSQATLPPDTFLQDMSFVSPDDGWAVGSKSDDKGAVPLSGVIYHFQHCQWQPYPISLPQIFLHSVSMVSADEGWAAGGVNNDVLPTVSALKSIVVLHYRHGQWQRVTIPGTHALVIGEVMMLSAQEGWLLGFDAQGNSALLHYANGVWSPAGLPIAINQAVQDAVTPVGPDDVWFATGTALPTDGDFTSVLVHFHHGQVTGFALPNDTSVRSLAFPKPDDGWLAGVVGNPLAGAGSQQPVLMHFDGTNWTNVSLPAFLPAQSAGQFDTYFTGMSLASAQEGFIIGYHLDDIDPIAPIILFHLHHGQWQIYPVPQSLVPVHADSKTVKMVSANEGWALIESPADIHVGGKVYVTHRSEILHFLDGTWSIYEQ
jgi:hypothetical protein